MLFQITLQDFPQEFKDINACSYGCSSFEPEMIGYKEHDWFVIKEKNKFLSIINSYPQGFLLYRVILLSGPMKGIYVKRLKPPTFDPQEDKNKQAAS